MRQRTPIRFVAVLLGVLPLGGTVSVFAQTGDIPQAASEKPSPLVPATGSSLPSSPPTGTATTDPPEHNSSAEPVARHVHVSYADGNLSVDAANGSLNQILQEVCTQTGMKITGGVSDERVFGTYGPAAPAVILAALLDGTESNMLLVQDEKGPAMLVLTPRRGGATPPNPNAAQAEAAGDGEQQNGPINRFAFANRPFRGPGINGRGPVAANADGSPSSEAPTPPQNNDASDSEDPGARPSTPQEIYDQLMKKSQPVTPQPQE